MPRKELLTRKRAAGICFDCARPVLDGHVRCVYHLHMDSRRRRRYYWRNLDRFKLFKQQQRQKALSEGRCLSCFNKLTELDHALVCNHCLEQDTIRKG